MNNLCKIITFVSLLASSFVYASPRNVNVCDQLVRQVVRYEQSKSNFNIRTIARLTNICKSIPGVNRELVSGYFQAYRVTNHISTLEVLLRNRLSIRMLATCNQVAFGGHSDSRCTSDRPSTSTFAGGGSCAPSREQLQIRNYCFNNIRRNQAGFESCSDAYFHTMRSLRRCLRRK